MKKEFYLTTIIELQQHLLNFEQDATFRSSIIAPLGEVTEVDGVFLCQNYQDEQGRLFPNILTQWWANPENSLGKILENLLIEDIFTNFLLLLIDGKYIVDNGLLIFPLMVKEQFVGILGLFDFDKSRVWELWEIELLELAANAISCTLAKLEEFNQRNRSTAALEKFIQQLSHIKYALDQTAIVLITDAAGVITYVNNKFCELCGFSRADLADKTPKILNSSYHSPEFFENLWQTITKGEIWRGEIRNKTKDGKYFWADTTIVPFLDKQNQPWQYLAILTDITKRKKIEEIVSQIAQAVSTQTDDAFFQVLVSSLAQTLQVDMALVGKLLVDEYQMQTVAFWADGAIQENIRYALHNTPCEKLLQQNIYHCPEGLRKLFPLDIFLQEQQLESYIGKPLFSSDNRCLGALVVLSRRPLPDSSIAKEILQIFANRASTELERRETLVALHKLNQELEERVEKRTVDLQQSQKFLRHVIDANPNMIFVKDKQGRFTLVNQSLANFFATSVDEIIGKKDSELIQCLPEIQYFENDDLEVIKSGLPKIIQEEVVTNFTGELHYFYTIKVPLIGSHGQPESVLGIRIDITQRKVAEQEIQKALAQEKELHELKTQFIDIASHEFRTPLTTIIGSADLLVKYGTKLSPDKQQKYLDNIMEAGQQMQQMIADILSMSRADFGKMLCDPKPVTIVKFCQHLVSELQRNIGKNHQWEFSWEGLEPEMQIKCDEKLLRHILINLLTNAIKYSPVNTKIEFQVQQQRGEVVFLITDQGIGIYPEDYPHIFDSFHRGQNVGEIPGTGLGLNIVKKYIDLHGGKVEFSSEVGKGTTFRVTIPIATPRNTAIVF